MGWLISWDQWCIVVVVSRTTWHIWHETFSKEYDCDLCFKIITWLHEATTAFFSLIHPSEWFSFFCCIHLSNVQLKTLPFHDPVTRVNRPTTETSAVLLTMLTYMWVLITPCFLSQANRGMRESNLTPYCGLVSSTTYPLLFTTTCKD